MAATLSDVELRALGCLVEKSRTTPELYPLTLNSLVNACNQKTSRDPVMSLEEPAVGQALFSLLQKGLAERVHEPGSRVPKFKHDVARLVGSDDPKRVAIFCLLILRGAQTAGEIKARADRLCEFAATAEVESLLQELSSSAEPLVERLARQPGQKETRYRHLLSGDAPAPALAAPTPAPARDRVAELEKRVAGLEAQFRELSERLSKPV